MASSALDVLNLNWPKVSRVVGHILTLDIGALKLVFFTQKAEILIPPS